MLYSIFVHIYIYIYLTYFNGVMYWQIVMLLEYI